MNRLSSRVGWTCRYTQNLPTLQYQSHSCVQSTMCFRTYLSNLNSIMVTELPSTAIILHDSNNRKDYHFAFSRIFSINSLYILIESLNCEISSLHAFFRLPSACLIFSSSQRISFLSLDRNISYYFHSQLIPPFSKLVSQSSHEIGMITKLIKISSIKIIFFFIGFSSSSFIFVDIFFHCVPVSRFVKSREC